MIYFNEAKFCNVCNEAFKNYKYIINITHIVANSAKSMKLLFDFKKPVTMLY